MFTSLTPMNAVRAGLFHRGASRRGQGAFRLPAKKEAAETGGLFASIVSCD